MKHKPTWIALDWGTTHLRAWAMDDTRILAHRATADGMANLNAEAFEPALLAHIGDWLSDTPVPIIACGMVGAKQGWQEAPYQSVYQSVPTTTHAQTIKIKTRDSRLRVWIAAGLMQENPPDVMRGEETQIRGFLCEHSDFNGQIVLPGTHSKWVRVANGAITGFHTALTGEVFSLISNHSVLKHSMYDRHNWDDKVFLESAMEAVKRPEFLLKNLFQIRARDLLNGDKTGQSHLSGALIGTEIGTQIGTQTTNQHTPPIVLIGAEDLSNLYARVLDALGIKHQQHTVQSTTIKGLYGIYQTIIKETS